MMNVFRIRLPHKFLRLVSILLLTVCADVAAVTGEATEPSPALRDLSVAAVIEDAAGSYSDLFVKLKQHPEFLRLCEKHGMDDPARWATLRRRFVLNRINLQADLSAAESMMSITDKRSALDDRLISHEETRTKGRDLKDQLVKKIEELKQMLRLIDEMEAVMAAVSREHALTGEISIKSLAGPSIIGQVLLVDENDLIVKRGDDGYFRVPSSMLSASTKRQVIEAIITAWPELPEIGADEAFNDEDAEALVAYDEAHLYLKDDAGELVTERRANKFFAFEPYQQQLESAREVTPTKPSRKNPEPAKVKILEDALALNQSRLATIAWHEQRLGFELMQREQE